MNKSDSERISAALKNSNHKPVFNIKEADLVIVNMCSVRQSAVDRVYGLEPKLKGKKTILTGCILNKDRKNLSKNFDYLLNIKDLPNWPRIFSKLLPENYLEIKPDYSNNFSAFLPVMTGCNNFCSYCVVPLTRGREISRPAKNIIKEVKDLADKGYKEIWLLGQNVNTYKSGKTSFSALLKKINDIPGDFWIRFTSPHPKDFPSELIQTMAGSEKVTEYLNLPVQSGDNKILKRMNRSYTIKQYKKLVKEIRKAIPNIAISTDIIVGFPGETEKQFNNTLKLFEEIKYDMAYVAKYSPRPQTAALKMKDDVSSKEKNRREKMLTKVLKKTALENNKKYIGKTEIILVSGCSNGFCTGKTRTHKTVKFRSLAKDLSGQFTEIKITKALPWGLKGEIKK